MNGIRPRITIGFRGQNERRPRLLAFAGSRSVVVTRLMLQQRDQQRDHSLASISSPDGDSASTRARENHRI
jgi:hypothetical protein